MKKYEKYKPSDVTWIGDIPMHWKVVRLKWFLEGNDGGVWGDDYDGIETNTTKVFRSTEINVDGTWNFDEEPALRVLSEQEKAKALLKEGDLLVTKSSGSQLHIGKTALVSKEIENMICCYSNFMQRLSPSNKKSSEYLHIFLNSQLSRDQYNYLSNSSIGLANLSAGIIGEILVPQQSTEEQIEISKFLRRKTNEIDKLIFNKKSLIEILKEERIAITNKAVTKGLKDKVVMRPSGVDWIGDIPENWKVTRVKYISTVQGRIGFKGYKSSDLVVEGEGALVLGASHITRDHKIDVSEPTFLSWEKYFESPEIMVKQGDIVFTQRGVYLGKVALIDKDYGDVTINPSLILLKENLINSGYLTFFLSSHYIRKSIELISSNTAIPMISQENLANFYCLIPADEEQVEIFDFVNKENSKIDLAITHIEKEIELMKEYRTALISEVVTGKIKVIA